MKKTETLLLKLIFRELIRPILRLTYQKITLILRAKRKRRRILMKKIITGLKEDSVVLIGLSGYRPGLITKMPRLTPETVSWK